MFKTTQNKGFQITFTNGNTVSVQFGGGNYCENRYANPDNGECENAEVLAWNKDGEYITEAIGWQTPEEVAAFIAKHSA